MSALKLFLSGFPAALYETLPDEVVVEPLIPLLERASKWAARRGHQLREVSPDEVRVTCRDDSLPFAKQVEIMITVLRLLHNGTSPSVERRSKLHIRIISGQFAAFSLSPADLAELATLNVELMIVNLSGG